jgi:hypothetical protein
VIFVHGITNHDSPAESLEWKVTLPGLLPDNSSITGFNLKTYIDDQFNLFEFVKVSRQVLEGLCDFFCKRTVRGIASSPFMWLWLKSRAQQELRPIAICCSGCGGFVVKVCQLLFP